MFAVQTSSVSFSVSKRNILLINYFSHGVVILGCKSPRCDCLLLHLSRQHLFHGHALTVAKELLFEITGFEIADT